MDFGCLDGGFDIVTNMLYHFEILGAKGVIWNINKTFFLNPYHGDQKGKECKKFGVLDDFVCYDGGYDIVT